MRALWHKGAHGDILYSWFYAKHVGPVDFYCPEMGWYDLNQFAALKRLAAMQPYISNFAASDLVPSGAVDMRYVVDNPADRERPNIIRPYFINNLHNWPGYSPWITTLDMPKGDYAAINVTARYRDSKFRWGTILPAGEMRFIGLPTEYDAFRHHLQHTGYQDTLKRLVYQPTADLYEASCCIAGANAFYGNASSCLALAQGLGVHEIMVEFDGTTVNTCRFGHEIILNPENISV